MGGDAIKKKLRDFIVLSFLRGCDSPSFNDSDSFLDKGIIDSTGILELVNFIQKTFRFRVEDEEIIPDNLDSLDRLASFIIRKQQ